MTSEQFSSRAPSDQAAGDQPSLTDLVGEWVAFPDIAERWDMPVTRVHNLVSERRLLAVRRPAPPMRAVPAAFLTDTGVLEPLRGTLVLLQDAGFDDEEALRWLFTPDESLPGRPIDALRDGHKTEVRRRAQALGW